MLNAERLSFRYRSGAAWVVRDVTLALAPGEVVGLHGPSGRGKTTLAKLLAGYLVPHTGQISVDGRPLPAYGACPVQLVFQHPELAVNPRWRIARILAEGHTPAQDVIDGLGIERSWLGRWPHELSGGELQRVAVARALDPGTRYLIADEITAMLDANTQAQIWQVVLAHARRHRLGVLVISHAGPLLERLCQRVVSMDVGSA
jgi:peptide/nickel transport system ATP-binding protein